MLKLMVWAGSGLLLSMIGYPSILAATPANTMVNVPQANADSRPFGSGHEEDAREAALPIPALKWGACAKDSEPTKIGGFVCATLKVPLDYDQPKGSQLSLAVVKHKALDPTRRVGTVIMNPGGPGGTGTAQIPDWLVFFPKELIERFDIVSWDPRGVGMSTPVQCFNSANEEKAFLGESENFPTTPEQQREYIRVWAKWAQRCAQATGGLAAHVSTADTARDLEQLRRAVGEPKLRFIGLSYGTFLGATYANLFPHRVGALVLDGNVAPKNWTAGGERNPRQSISLRIGSDAGTGLSMRKFLELCGQTSQDRCGFTGGTPEATRHKWDELLDRLWLGPIIVGYDKQNAPIVVSYRKLLGGLGNGFDFVQPFQGSPQGAPSVQGWSGIAQALQKLWEKRDTPLPVSSPTTTTSPATPPKSRYQGVEQTLAVMCGDSPNPRNPNYYIRESQNVIDRDGPIGLASLWADEPCANWTIREEDTYTGPWNRPTANPILVVGNTFDPSTPYQNSLDMVEQLADARLLTVEGFGHTEMLNPSDCANAYIVEYLVSGALPPIGTVCQQNKPPFAPPAP